MDWRCPRCTAENRADATSCYFCGADRPESAAPAPGGDITADALAGADVYGAPGAQPMSLPIGPGGLVGGVVVSLIAAALATAGWYLVVALSNYQIAFVAVAVGWLVGTGVVLGARGRLLWPLIGVAAAFTLISLAVSEYLIVYHFLTEYARGELGLGNVLELIQPPDVMLEFVVASLEDDPLTLLFWAVAMVVAVVIPYRAWQQARRPAPLDATTRSGVNSPTNL